MRTTTPGLLRKTPAEIDRQARLPVDDRTRLEASRIVEAVRLGGEAAVRECAARFGERQTEQPLVLGRPEMHAALNALNPDAVARRVRHAGAIFCGPRSAEVLGDYGAGPNHTLPTGGTARFQAGLSVTHFIRLRTWLRLEDTAEANELIADTMRLARIEQLAGHEESAQRRGRLSHRESKRVGER